MKVQIDREDWHRMLQVITIAGGFFMLMIEIRFQHRAALIGDWRPWMPIIFCNAMIFLSPIAGIFWRKGGKVALRILYTLTIMLGVIGMYFHSGGHLIERIAEVTSVWSISLQNGAAIVSQHPPVLAPLAFVGLGFLGLLASATDRTQSISLDEFACARRTGDALAEMVSADSRASARQ